MTPTALGPDATLSDLGEFGLVDALAGVFRARRQVLLGPGDDAAVVAVDSGRAVVSTDMLVEGRHFRRDWASAADVGHKAAAQNLSDINAMGGRCTALTVALAAPPDLPVAWALELAQGIEEEAALVGASVVGGDLTRARDVTISITAIGEVAGEPVLRSGARPGDVVAITGRQGWAAAGLAVLARGFRSPRALVEAHRRPQPPYDQGPAVVGSATAMIDVSDGLLADLGHVAEASGVAIDVETAAFPLPEPFHAVAAALGVDPLRFILAGGDDHALVATFPPDRALPDGWTAVGRVSEAAGGATVGVTVDGAAYDGPTGHTHF
jgi:thiamine-monophosphate kinase